MLTGKHTCEVSSSLKSEWLAPSVLWLCSRKVSPKCQVVLARFCKPPMHKPLMTRVTQQAYLGVAGTNKSSDAELMYYKQNLGWRAMHSVLRTTHSI